MMKKILFFDIDGVLHPLGIAFENGDGAIYCDPPHLRFVWAPILMTLLAQRPDVFLVCHSTWRRNYTLPALGAMLPSDLAARLIGLTDPNLDRLPSIQAYVEDHRIAHDCYVIIDDDPAAFPVAPEQLVLVSSRTGISAEVAQAALRSALARL